MKNKNSIKFILGTKGVIPSINSIYKAKLIYKYGRPVPTIYKDSVAVKVTEEINEQLKMIDFKEKAPWIFKKDAVFNLTIQFIFKQSFFKRDLDNLMKVVQDAIFRHFKINDSRVIELHTFKSILPNLTEEKICVSLSESSSEIRFDQLEELPVPSRLFLGGTKDETVWKELLPPLDKLGYSYFNPIGDDITEKNREKERNEECDCHFYLINKETLTPKIIAEIIDSAYTVRESGFGCMMLGIFQEDSVTEEDISSISYLIDLVNNISNGSKNIVGRLIKNSTELLENLGIPKKKRKRKE